MDPQTRQLPNNWRTAKFIWRAVLIFNLGLGAFLFTRPAKKERKATTTLSITPVETTSPSPPPQDYDALFFPNPEPMKLPEPLSIEQQRSIFEWMLEEKRKVKPQNREEKKRINEEKALLKQFIRADSIPKI